MEVECPCLRFKNQLEEILTDIIRKEQPKISPVTISSDGEFAIYNLADCYNVRKLSPKAKEFLRSGDFERLRNAQLFL